jgi:hypothetical protein
MFNCESIVDEIDSAYAKNYRYEAVAIPRTAQKMACVGWFLKDEIV